MIGRDVENKNYDKINLIEKTWRKNNEYNITYHGSWYRQPIWMNITVRQSRQSGVVRATCPD